MFRTIIRIVKSAVAAAFKAMRRAALITAAGVAGAASMLFGREEPLPEPGYVPDSLDVEQTEIEHAASEMREAEGRFASNPNACAYAFVCAPRSMRHTVDISSMPPEAHRWVSRLSDSECILVRRAGCEGMLKHIAGKKTIQGVAPVRKIQQTEDFTQRRQADNAADEIHGFNPAMRLAM